jgi:hypothetical protein
MVSHPYSIYIWRPPRSPRDERPQDEPIQAYTEEWAIYAANLIHQDSKAMIKVVRYGINLLCLPDAHTVELVERQIARQKKPRDTEDLEPEITLLNENDSSEI